jgi:hypothetical protein
MVGNKAKTRRDSQRLMQVPRTTSHTRFKSPTQRQDDSTVGAGGPSTLPPPPFENEVAVRALEWWIDAHMALASELLWLQQLPDGPVEGDLHRQTIGVIAVRVEAVRDALYELYCDAADDRMAPLLGPEAALERYVRDCYAWCARVVGLLASVMGGLRSGGVPDWAGAKAEFRLAAAQYVTLSPLDLSAARALTIDFSSPVEPLRNLPEDLDRLVATVRELHATLEKRFG